MAENTRELKRRMRSIESTEHITNAMRLVSAAKFRKAKSLFDQKSLQLREVTETMELLLAGQNVSEREKPCEAASSAAAERVLAIVICGDRGLCGGFNSNLIKTADEALREYGELAEKYVVYRPQYVPDGFVLEEVPDLQGGIRVCDYKNGEGEWISFTQCEIGSTTTCVDTEDAYQEEIELNGEKAMYILKNDLQTLIWDDDRYSFLLHVPLTDGIDQEEAVKIAESLAPVE